MGMKRRREEATTTTAVLDNDEMTGEKQRGGDWGDWRTSVRIATPGSVSRFPRRRRPVYLEGDDFRVAERPAAERRHRPL